MLLRSCLLFALCVSPVWSTLAAEAKAEPAESVFFAFDNESLAWQQNLTLTLVSPEKHPANPVVRCEQQ